MSLARPLLPRTRTMELRPSLTVWGKRIEIFLAGYHTEHFVLALQVRSREVCAQGFHCCDVHDASDGLTCASLYS